MTADKEHYESLLKESQSNLIISEGFNSFFTYIGPTLANQVPHDDS